MNKELAKTLTTALVQFIDKERPEGTMCCSNTDCENIMAAFEEGEYDCIEAFIQKKLSRLTEFEKCMLDFAEAKDEYEFDSTKVVELNNKVIELTKLYSNTLLNLAKKELFKQGEGTYYYSPKNDELTYIDSMPMRMPYAVLEKHTLGPLCYEPGGTCTNPHFDCINCPKKTTGGMFTSSNTTTPCGTYTIGYESVNNH